LQLNKNIVCCKHIEYLLEISKIFLESLEVNNNVVNVDSRELTIISKKFVNLTLNVRKRVFVFYYNNVKEFLFTITYYCKLVTILEMYALLVEER